ARVIGAAGQSGALRMATAASAFGSGDSSASPAGAPLTASMYASRSAYSRSDRKPGLFAGIVVRRYSKSTPSERPSQFRRNFGPPIGFVENMSGSSGAPSSRLPWHLPHGPG